MVSRKGRLCLWLSQTAPKLPFAAPRCCPCLHFMLWPMWGFFCFFFFALCSYRFSDEMLFFPYKYFTDFTVSGCIFVLLKCLSQSQPAFVCRTCEFLVVQIEMWERTTGESMWNPKLAQFHSMPTLYQWSPSKVLAGIRSKIAPVISSLQVNISDWLNEMLLKALLMHLNVLMYCLCVAKSLILICRLCPSTFKKPFRSGNFYCPCYY